MLSFSSLRVNCTCDGDHSTSALTVRICTIAYNKDKDLLCIQESATCKGQLEEVPTVEHMDTRGVECELCNHIQHLLLQIYKSWRLSARPTWHAHKENSFYSLLKHLVSQINICKSFISCKHSCTYCT